MTLRATTTFELPATLSASSPPEARGLARDGVRLLVARPDRVDHSVFSALSSHLHEGDLVVVNTSATIPAALSGRRPDGRTVVVHLSSPLAGSAHVVELRSADGSVRVGDAREGERIGLAEGSVLLRHAYPDPTVRVGSRLWQATFDDIDDLSALLTAHGRPIAYGYVDGDWPLEAYQTVFGRLPGSAEMASAGRPFSDRLVSDLVTAGVTMAPIMLHTGVSSLEADEVPLPERYLVPRATADLVNHTRRHGGRVIAVGTTVTRALESVADAAGVVHADEGWTDLVLGPDRPARVVDGLVTGWHEPQASHLMLLEAVAGPALVQRAYDAALAGGYLWHEFGDSALLLP